MISTAPSKKRAEGKNKSGASRVRTITSAGAVLFSVSGTGDLRYLLLGSKTGVWGFPKGKKEKGESDVETAVREVREETGILDFFIIPGFRRSYSFERGKKFAKTVLLYAARTRQKRAHLSREHVRYAWLSYDAALARIMFPEVRAVFESLHGYLLKQRRLHALAERVYGVVARIPRGRVASYRDVARAAGGAVTPRLVGLFMRLNYDSAVPCHRVIADNSGISGYNRGVGDKMRILKQEGVGITGRGPAARVVPLERFRHVF